LKIEVGQPRILLDMGLKDIVLALNLNTKRNYILSMSRTRRIYNRIVKKAHRYSAEFYNHTIHTYGFIFHPYRALCMGHCGFCRNPEFDQKHQRKVRKQEFMRALEMELP